MKYPVNRLRVGQTIRARSRERGIITLTIERIRWQEDAAVLYDAEGQKETLNPFDWVDLMEGKENDEI